MYQSKINAIIKNKSDNQVFPVATRDIIMIIVASRKADFHTGILLILSKKDILLYMYNKIYKNSSFDSI